mmetsp:Transcript_13371/g.40434  ORF Transcript_13371/g.40434 Transcript_13371/m.40434 type:complete len:353 (-) Transcript_13371:462-1520(-)
MGHVTLASILYQPAQSGGERRVKKSHLRHPDERQGLALQAGKGQLGGSEAVLSNNEIPRDVLTARASSESHGMFKLSAQCFEDGPCACLAAQCQAPQQRATQHDRICPQRQRLDDIGAAANPAINNERNLAGPCSHGSGDVRQHVQRRGGAVALAAPMVADHDAVHPRPHRQHSICRRQHPLDKDGKASNCAQPGHEVPCQAGVQMLCEHLCYARPSCFAALIDGQAFSQAVQINQVHALRQSKLVPYVSLPLPQPWCIHCNYQCAKALPLRFLNQAAREITLAKDVQLKPQSSWVLCRCRYLRQSVGAHRGYPHDGAGLIASPCCGQLTVRMRHPLHRHRRCYDRPLKRPP